ncbi:4-hydroxy-2-oxo-heptane-1,7-dioate aldolase [compost metagenome]
MQQAIEKAIRTIVASGKAAGTLTGDAKLARHYLELGATFVAVGLDLTLLARATRGLANDFGLGALSAPPASGASPY